ncbi:hypothetical protein LJC58_09750, partial [Lachnospiraceae bacterium OttesenSCG-928-D06]|nr:hypothetical protein [Lachnospiraceae bacterium OttesenSCG-928-D06]
MKIRKKNIFQSTIFRIVAVVIILVLPINIMTLILSRMVLDKNQEQMTKDFQTALEWNMENLQTTMTSASKRLISLSINDAEFISLAKSANRENTSDNSKQINHVAKTLKSLQSEYPWMDLMYFYFPQTDYLISAGYPGVSHESCRKQIRNAANSKEDITQNWSVGEIDGTGIAFSLNSWNDADFGIIINLERLLGRLNFGEDWEGKVVLFTNKDRTIFTEKGQEYFEEQQMTLEEMEQSKRYQVFIAEGEKSDLVMVEIVDWERQMANLPFTITMLQVIP